MSTKQWFTMLYMVTSCPNKETSVFLLRVKVNNPKKYTGNLNNV